MTKDDILELAKEAGPLISTPFDVWCERFAALVAAAERKACAHIAEDWDSDLACPREVADAIRARGEK